MNGYYEATWRVQTMSLDPSGRLSATVTDPNGFIWDVVMDYPGHWKIGAGDDIEPTIIERRAIKRVVLLRLIELAAGKVRYSDVSW